MDSHWDSLPTIRVVDAGYLLAGLEPERKWRNAPPMVVNFFNLIHDRTGAVKLATLPGERMEITKAEFQALKAQYGVMPEQSPATPAPVVQATETKEQRQDRRLKACIDAGLPMNDKRALSRLPDGVGDVADRESVTRQAFSTDVKAALERRASANREGVKVHRA